MGSTHTCAIDVSGDIECWGVYLDSFMSPLATVDIPTDFENPVVIASGGIHTCAIDHDGELACWGSNNAGQRDVPSSLGPAIAVAGGYSHTCAIDQAHTVHCWGGDYLGQSSVPADLGPALAVATQGDHTCAVKYGGEVECWGRSDYGQSTTPTGWPMRAGFMDAPLGYTRTGDWTYSPICETASHTWGFRVPSAGNQHSLLSLGCFDSSGNASALCGNSQTEEGETCDDGNTVSGDGCSNTCQTESDSSVDPSNCSHPNYYADGWCDMNNNVAGCGWDGGDCCESTCVDGPQYSCGQSGYNCLDPNAN